MDRRRLVWCVAGVIVVLLVGGFWWSRIDRQGAPVTVESDRAITSAKDEIRWLEKAVEAVDRRIVKEVSVHVSVSSDDVVDHLGCLVREYRRSRDRL